MVNCCYSTLGVVTCSFVREGLPRDHEHWATWCFFAFSNPLQGLFFQYSFCILLWFVIIFSMFSIGLVCRWVWRTKMIKLQQRHKFCLLSCHKLLCVFISLLAYYIELELIFDYCNCVLIHSGKHRLSIRRFYHVLEVTHLLFDCLCVCLDALSSIPKLKQNWTIFFSSNSVWFRQFTLICPQNWVFLLGVAFLIFVVLEPA